MVSESIEGCHRKSGRESSKEVPCEAGSRFLVLKWVRNPRCVDIVDSCPGKHGASRKRLQSDRRNSCEERQRNTCPAGKLQRRVGPAG